MTHFSKKQFQSNLMIKVLNNFSNTAQKMKFSIKDFFSNCDQIRSFIFCAVQTFDLEICLNWETNNYNVLIGQYLNKQKQSDNELI